jgi:hypothetical protein
MGRKASSNRHRILFRSVPLSIGVDLHRKSIYRQYLSWGATEASAPNLICRRPCREVGGAETGVREDRQRRRKVGIGENVSLRRRDGSTGARFTPYLCCGEIRELDEKPAVWLRAGLPVALFQCLIDQCGMRLGRLKVAKVSACHR